MGLQWRGGTCFCCGVEHVEVYVGLPAATVRRYSSTQTANTAAAAAVDEDVDDDVPFIPFA